jgi:hypothetical protein
MLMYTYSTKLRSNSHYLVVFHNNKQPLNNSTMASHGQNFQPSDAMAFNLKITNHDARTGAVCSITYQFCTWLTHVDGQDGHFRM